MFDNLEFDLKYLSDSDIHGVIRYLAKIKHLNSGDVSAILDHIEFFDDYRKFKIAEVLVRRKIVAVDHFLNKISPTKYAVLVDYFEYLNSNPLPLAKSLVRDIESYKKYMTDGGHSISEMIIEAVEKKIPFSATRIGDGEGRFLYKFSEYPGFQKYFQEVANSVWFWNSMEKPDINSVFFDQLRSSFLRSDIVGFNPFSRVEMEWGNGCLGYVGVNSSNLFLSENKSKISFVAPNWFNVELQNVGFFDKIRDHEIFIIGPYSEVIGNCFPPFRRVEFIRIPSENNPLTRKISIKESHYPQVFFKTLDECKNMKGKVVLVAGGAFGKIYCDAIKQAGGVAIDIGSLLDNWMGLRTR